MFLTVSIRESVFSKSAGLLRVVVTLVFLVWCVPVASAVTYVGGSITNDVTWGFAGSPYHVTNDVTVNAGATLTIESGVVVKFEARSGADGQYRRRLFVNGQLMAQGTSGSPIIFTSSRDDLAAHGGDSNGDGGSTTPASDNWGYVKISGAGSALEHCEFWYGGVGYRYSGSSSVLEPYLLWISGPNPAMEVRHCTFNQVFSTALQYEGAVGLTSPVIADNAITNCVNGIWVNGNSSGYTRVVVTNNAVNGASGTAIHVDDAMSESVVAGNGIVGGGNGIDVDGLAGGLSKVLVTNNTFSLLSGTAIDVDNITSDSVVSGNLIQGGNEGLVFRNTSPLVQNNTLNNTTGYPYRHVGMANPSYSGNTLSGVAKRFLAVEGTLTGNRTWGPVAGLTYLVSDDLTVGAGATLTIESGVVVKFEARSPNCLGQPGVAAGKGFVPRETEVRGVG